MASREISNFQSLLALVCFLAVTFSVAALGSAATIPEIPGWYAGLAKPTFNPPNWIFGPVWSLLYALMAVAAWRVWRECGLVHRAMLLFAIQLLLNLAWSWLFFGAHRPDLAVIEVALLDAAVLATLILFWRIDRIAGTLLIPYLAWISFATVLNASIVRLNG